jgi:predicted transcriptional regulator
MEKAFVKEVVAEMPDPKPHYNTVSTIIRNLEDKGFIGHDAFGKTHRYHPVISKEEYRKKSMQKTINHYFENSYKNVVSFFAREEKISADELREIIDLIEKNQGNPSEK